KLTVTYTLNSDSQKLQPNAAAAWEVEVFPNPAAENVVFDFNDINDGDQLQLSIFTITGQLIRKELISGADTYNMNISQLNPGMYFFDAENQTTNTRYSGKFLKQ
ncbi:MAG: T9SS type A sorting domain-containing protein, partial [Chitinophagales bacterium]